jgi:hypothetical protein
VAAQLEENLRDEGRALAVREAAIEGRIREISRAANSQNTRNKLFKSVKRGAQMSNVAEQTLIAKLAAACDAVGGVEKKGRNEIQNYPYLKAADVAKAIRHELFKRGILCLVNEKKWSEISRIKTNSGAEMPLMVLEAEVIFRDEKDSITTTAFATAFDKGDKAVYKAKTGLLKYALRGIGLIPDEKDDPEFDESVDEMTDPRATNGKRKQKIQEFQARGWESACRSTGKTAQQIATFLTARYSATSVVELTPDEFNEAIKWAVGSEDLAKTLQTSTDAVNGKKQPIVAVMDRPIRDEVAGD